MNSRVLPLLGACALGFAGAVLLFSAAPRPASAQLKTQPMPTLQTYSGQQNALPVQPIAIQSLDNQHFVVATREPRLVVQIGREGPVQQMLVPVVTHYTVRGDRLLPIEHVRAPSGFRVIEIEP